MIEYHRTKYFLQNFSALNFYFLSQMLHDIISFCNRSLCESIPNFYEAYIWNACRNNTNFQDDMTPDEFGDAFDLAVPIRHNYYVLKPWSSKDEERVQAQSNPNKITRKTFVGGLKSQTLQKSKDSVEKLNKKNYYKGGNTKQDEKISFMHSNVPQIDPPIVREKTLLLTSSKQRETVPIDNPCSTFSESRPTVIVADIDKPESPPQSRSNFKGESPVLNLLNIYFTKKIGMVNLNSVKMTDMNSKNLDQKTEKAQHVSNIKSSTIEKLFNLQTHCYDEESILIENKNEAQAILEDFKIMTDDSEKIAIERPSNSININREIKSTSVDVPNVLSDVNEFSIPGTTSIGCTISAESTIASEIVKKDIVNSSPRKSSLIHSKAETEHNMKNDLDFIKLKKLTPFGLEVIVEDQEPIFMSPPNIHTTSRDQYDQWNQRVESVPIESIHNLLSPVDNAEVDIETFRDFGTLVKSIDIPEYLDPPNHTITTPDTDETTKLLGSKSPNTDLKQSRCHVRSRFNIQRKKKGLSNQSFAESIDVHNRISYVKPVIYLRKAILYFYQEIQYLWNCLHSGRG